MKTKFFLCLFSVITLTGFGQELIQRYIDNANRQFVIGDYERAYSLINFVLRSQGAGNISVEARVTGEKIYYAHLQEGIKDKNTLLISDI